MRLPWSGRVGRAQGCILIGMQGEAGRAGLGAACRQGGHGQP